MNHEPIAEPPRIAILDHTASLGGGEIALLNLARAIDPQRFKIIVVLFADGPLREKLHQAGIETVLVPLDARIADARKDSLGSSALLRISDGFRSIRFIRRLAKALRKLDPQIVHTNSLKSDVLGGIAARLAGVKVIWHVRDRIADDYLPRSVVKVFRLLATTVPHKVVANSYATLSTLTDQRTQNFDGRYIVIHDGTEVRPRPNARQPDDQLRVGLVGRISPWKGQHIFLEAIGLVRDRFPSARFQIIGSALFSEAEYEKQLHALATSLNLNDIVTFTGFREDVLQLVEQLDLLVHASTIGEPFGQVILEGMAAGKAVVATRGGGVPEFVTDGVTGLLVPMGDASALADAMAKVLADPELRSNLGRQARESVICGFTIQHTADKVQSLYDHILKSR